MKEFKFCGEITEYVEIPVYVCETQKEMVKEISEIRDVLTFVDEARENLLDTAVSNEEETSVYIIYKDGSVYFKTLDEEEGKFKRYGIKAAVIETAFEYTVYGDFAVTDNGDISIEESDIEEYGVYAGQYDVKEQTEETAPEAAETVESVEETTVSETETVEETAEQEVETAEQTETEIEETVKSGKFYAVAIAHNTNEIEELSLVYDSYSEAMKIAKYYADVYGKNNVFIGTMQTLEPKTCKWYCYNSISETTAEQETELNAEIAEVEAEQTAETETISKSESESEPTVDSNTVETYQDNINVLIVADIANTFEMITHTGYFDTS